MTDQNCDKTLCYAGFTYDEVRKSFTYGGIQFKLQKRDLVCGIVLRELIKAAGRVCSLVYFVSLPGEEAHLMNFPTSVRAAIFRLRNRLEKLGIPKTHLRTIARRGYALDPHITLE